MPCSSHRIASLTPASSRHSHSGRSLPYLRVTIVFRHAAETYTRRLANPSQASPLAQGYAGVASSASLVTVWESSGLVPRMQQPPPEGGATHSINTMAWR
ncbi:hypothetical protein E2C01_073022 [Portunus trituberculatus]|uniref:Uncharacterized protein n=1 Tax=Portunus trituberculatus TaxID=210409 RepID=A0A5B7ICY9_PORTR|nr:hypothetical protein [Portunus trituberculatus]